MERNVNYTLIGIILCILLVAMTTFVLWIGRLGLDKKEYLIYQINTLEDISGIGVNTPVKYKGIVVGHVYKLGFKEGSVGAVNIEILIQKKIPVKTDSYIMMDSSGIAGLTYLSLKQGAKGSIITQNNQILDMRKNALGQIFDDAGNISKDLKYVIANIKEITNPQRVDKILELLNDIKSTKQNLDNLLISANTLVVHADKQLENGEFNIKNIFSPIMLDLQDGVIQMREFFQKGSSFLDNLDANPYETLLGKPSDK